MTRKQALQKAIERMGDGEEAREIVEQLQNISTDLPLTHWSDKSIRDTVDQFIVDNGRVPTASDFRKRGMPPHPVFKQKYNMTLRAWLNINYPVEDTSFEERRFEFTLSFMKEYLQLKPVSQNKYDSMRSAGCPCAQTVMKYNGCSTWHGLLNKLQLQGYSGIAIGHSKQIKSVSVIIDLEEQLKQLQVDVPELRDV